MSTGDFTKELDDDVLRDILLRLPFSSSLVRAAFVCKQWLRVASDPDFLRRFHDLHDPPRVLGFYLETLRRRQGYVKFVPMPHLPEEFASVACRLAAERHGNGVDGYFSIVDCRNGRLLVRRYSPMRHGERGVAVVNPLHGESSAAVVLPPLPFFPTPYRAAMSLDADGAGVVVADSCYNSGGPGYPVVRLHKLRLQHRAWHRLASPSPKPELRGYPSFLLKGKVYIVLKATAIVAVPCMEPSTSTIDPSIIRLPRGVINCGFTRNCNMSLADDDSGLYLVDEDSVQIRVYLHTRRDNWSLVDSISMNQVRSEVGLPTETDYDDDTPAKLRYVGDNAEFLFLELGDELVYIHFKSRVVQKVYSLTGEDKYLINFAPFTMPWPPIFPVFKDEVHRQ